MMMNIDLSPQNEPFIEQIIARGTFHDRTEALDLAVDLLRRRQELLDHIDEGTRQLHNGQGIVINDNDALLSLLNRIQDEGMQRYQEYKTAQ